MDIHNRENVMENIKSEKITIFAFPQMKKVLGIKTYNFFHPQALLHPPTIPPRDFAGFTCFYVLKLNI